MKRQLVAALGLILVVGSASAQQPIEGAFGVKLGDIFDLNNSIGQYTMPDDLIMYEFTPTNPFHWFDHYYVMVTPQTQVIHSIWGIGSVRHIDYCEEEAALIYEALQKRYEKKGQAERTAKKIILEILHDRYGDTERETLTDGTDTPMRTEQKQRGVLVGCTEAGTLEIRYYDRRLDRQARREKLELEANKIEDIGL